MPDPLSKGLVGGVQILENVWALFVVSSSLLAYVWPDGWVRNEEFEKPLRKKEEVIRKTSVVVTLHVSRLVCC